jgi:DNA repair protein RadC
MRHTPTTPGSKRYRLRLATWTVVRDAGQPSPRILSDPTAAALLAIDLARAHDDDKEHLFAVLLNSRNHYLMHTEVSVGTGDFAPAEPRAILGPALREGASALIVVHTHPSGDPEPSRDDIALTRRLASAADVVGLRLHDHIIVGGGTQRWVSLAQRGAL